MKNIKYEKALSLRRFALMLTLLAMMSLLTASTLSAADGDLDASFDSDGKVSTDIGAIFDSANNAAQQADGKIVTVGTTRNTDTDADNLLLVRYNTDGSLDTMFGTGGRVLVFNTTNPSTTFGTASGIAFQADGKILVSVSGRSNLFRFNADGSRDASFGTNGVLTIPAVGNFTISANDVAVLPGGKILVAGTGSNSTFIQGFGLARLDQDGSLDSSFGSGGIVYTAFTSGTTAAGATEIALAANGKIALGGSVNPQTTPGQPGIAVYNANGSLDQTFGAGGRVLLTGTNVNFFGSLAWQTDGKIVTVGRRQRSGDTSPAAYFQRFTASGAVDNSFGTNGEVFPILTNRPLITLNDVVIQPDGKILGFGSGFVSFQGNLSAWMTVVRLLPSGAFDSTFGTNGIVTTPFNTSFSGNQSQALTGFLQTDGKIVAAGTETVINATAGTVNVNIAIARYLNTPGNVPVNNPTLRIADFDGDGKADASVFRAGTWFINPSGSPSFADAPNAAYGVQFGQTGDKLTPADFDGDGKTDIAVWREAAFAYFYILNSSNNTFRAEQFGTTGDNPVVVGNWDADGKADLAVYRQASNAGETSIFYFRPTAQTGVDFVPIMWGTDSDKATRGDFDGDGKLDAAVFRPSNGVWYIRQSSDNQSVYKQFGAATDQLVSGDFDADGKTDQAIFRDGLWAVLQSSNNAQIYRQFGQTGDAVAAADYDGDGRCDFAVFRNGVYYILNNANSQTSVQQFGAVNDTPIAAAFVQ